MRSSSKKADADTLNSLFGNDNDFTSSSVSCLTPDEQLVI